jgi:hypothetical protein
MLSELGILESSIVNSLLELVTELIFGYLLKNSSRSLQ